jgi:hypothetical protein
MVLKILSFIFAISLAFGFPVSKKVENVPFNVNDVINRVSHHSQPHNPQSQAPNLSGEFLIDTGIVYIPNPENQMSPSVAFDGTNYLVVWDDDRSISNWNIYGARVNQTGEILDPDGFIISNAPYDQQFSSVAFDGTNYLVVWQDERSNDSYDIYGARVNQDGTVLDPGGFVISNALYDQIYPRITFDSTNYFVVWQDMRHNDWDIYGARVNEAGVLIDTNGIAITVAPDSQSSPSVTSSGNNYFVVWHDNRSGAVDIYGTRVNFSGVVLDTAGIAISTATHEQGHPSVTFDGTNYFVVWDDYRIRTRGIYGARVTQEGTVLDTSGICISLAPIDRIRPSVDFDGTNYFVIWQDYRNQNCDIYGARVNQDGFVVDTAGIAISTMTNEQRRPALAFDGTNHFVVWEDFRSEYQWDVYGAKVDQAGAVLDSNGITVSSSVNRQETPSAAFDGTNYLVVWADERGDPEEFDIYGALLNQTGVANDSTYIVVIAISTAAGWQGNPAVAFDGTNYLVVWADERNGIYPDIYGTRVSPTGTVFDTNGIAISTAQNEQMFPNIAFDGTNYLVVWEDYRVGGSHIYGARVNQSGGVIDTNGILISSATANLPRFPTITFGSTNYLVAWSETHSGSSDDIYGKRVNQSGIVLDSNGIAISTAAHYQWLPSVAFDGNNYLVVWHDERTYTYPNIYCSRVNQSGFVLDTNGIAISTASTYESFPCVAFDGANYIIVWQRGADIYGARVSPQGLITDSFPVSTQSGTQESPKLAHGLGNQVLTTYSGWTDSINLHPVNTMRIWSKFYPFIGIAEENAKVKMQSSKLLEVFPNPARSFLAVRLPQSTDRLPIKIFDVSGKLVKIVDKVTSAQSHKQEVIISLKGINPGIYFLRFGKENKKFLVVE